MNGMGTGVTYASYRRDDEGGIRLDMAESSLMPVDAATVATSDAYTISFSGPDGELGELVFTSLSKEAFPIVRYRTRDLTRLLPGTARAMRRMEKVTGRTDDMIILRGVNVFPTQIEEQILKIEGLD